MVWFVCKMQLRMCTFASENLMVKGLTVVCVHSQLTLSYTQVTI